MFFDEIKITKNEILKLIESDGAGLTKYIEFYIKRKFYIGDTGINRKTLKDWEKAELLPYEYKGEGWRKFSFVEWVWLVMINEFRQLGVSTDKIREIKRIVFDIDPEELFSFLKKTIESYKENIDQKEMILAAYNHPDVSHEMKMAIITDLQLGPLTWILMAVVLLDQNIAIAYNNQDFCSFFVMGLRDEKNMKNNQDIFINLLNDSFLVVNLRKVVNKIFQKPELRHNDNFILDFLSHKEKKIIDHIRDTNAKEIVISFDKESNPIQIKVNRNRISEETINKVARYLKKGDFQHISFKTRDGQLISYNETDIIKI